jgi:hypothetical protein
MTLPVKFDWLQSGGNCDPVFLYERQTKIFKRIEFFKVLNLRVETKILIFWIEIRPDWLMKLDCNTQRIFNALDKKIFTFRFI